MTKMPPDWKPRRVPLRVPERQISSEEKARREAESEAFYQRCRAIFERIRPELIQEHYNWYIIIEPDSGEYFIDEDDMVAYQKMREKLPLGKVMTMRLNETGTCGRICSKASLTCRRHRAKHGLMSMREPYIWMDKSSMLPFWEETQSLKFCSVCARLKN